MVTKPIPSRTQPLGLFVQPRWSAKPRKILCTPRHQVHTLPPFWGHVCVLHTHIHPNAHSAVAQSEQPIFVFQISLGTCFAILFIACSCVQRYDSSSAHWKLSVWAVVLKLQAPFVQNYFHRSSTDVLQPPHGIFISKTICMANVLPAKCHQKWLVVKIVVNFRFANPSDNSLWVGWTTLSMQSPLGRVQPVVSL